MIGIADFTSDIFCGAGPISLGVGSRKWKTRVAGFIKKSGLLDSVVYVLYDGAPVEGRLSYGEYGEPGKNGGRSVGYVVEGEGMEVPIYLRNVESIVSLSNRGVIC